MNKIIVFLCFLFLTFNLKAQTFKIDTSSITYENKLRPCLLTQIDASANDTKRAWIKFVKKNYEVKLKGFGFLKNKDMLTATDVTISKISSKRMNVYTRILSTANGTEIKYFASFGYDFFIGPNSFPTEFEIMKNDFNTFLNAYLNEFYTDEIDSYTKKIKSLEKDKSNMSKKIAKTQDKLLAYKKDLAVIEVEIAHKNITDSKLIEKQSKLNNKITDAERSNVNSTLKIKEIDEMLNNTKQVLEILKTKHFNLIKN